MDVDASTRSVFDNSALLQPPHDRSRSSWGIVQGDIVPLTWKQYFNEALYVLAFSTFILAIVKYASKRSRRVSYNLSSSQDAVGKALSSTGARSRAPGTWEPSSFKFPTPPPYPDWSIETTKPIPYRPFRYGPKYFVTMGLRYLKHEEWIELDNLFPRFHTEKTRRIQERGKKCCYTKPDAYGAAVELLTELSSYLIARYPTLYQRSQRGIKNLWSGEEIDTTSQPLPEDPMQSCARLTQDDIAIMMEKPDGKYYFEAGAILLAGFWRLEDKLGMSLSEIHTSGNVPHYEEKLEKGMSNLFRRLKPEELVARNNYVLQVDENLPWSTSVGSEDSNERGWHLAPENLSIEHHHFRAERQTLRRLPKSGAVVFTIHTYFLPITEIAQEDYVPGRLASSIRSWTDDISKYKGKKNFQDVLLKYLDEQHQKQIERGLKLEEEDEKRKYPL